MPDWLIVSFLLLEMLIVKGRLLGATAAVLIMVVVVVTVRRRFATGLCVWGGGWARDRGESCELLPLKGRVWVGSAVIRKKARNSSKSKDLFIIISF